MTIPDLREHSTRLDRVGPRALGAFYTPDDTAGHMADWLLREGGKRILEPSVGDGAFVEALRRTAAARLMPDPEVIGIELATDTFDAAVAAGLIDPQTSLRRDFLEVPRFPVDAVIGNPPYVRLRHLDPRAREAALRIAEEALGARMDPSGSTWMPFALHATGFLEPGGRMALVLPYEFTYVRYALPLWRFLGRSFGSLRVVRVRERMFPEIMQETVLLFADERGGATEEVVLETHEAIADLLAGRSSGRAAIDLAEIEAGERPFLLGLLPSDLRALVGEIRPRTRPVGEVARWRTGYVSGDKGFFHPDPATADHFGLPERSLPATLASGRGIDRGGVSTAGTTRHDRLFLPPADAAEHGQGERDYVAHGEDLGIDRRFKCRIRETWFRVTGTGVPDLIVPVFSEKPQLLRNDAGLLATNSFMCGYLDRESRDALLATWYSSLTLLEAELRVHSLSGGVFVFVPRELAAMRVPSGRAPAAGIARRIAELEAAPERIDQFRPGDQFVLGDVLGLGPDEIRLVREGAATLAAWRRAAGASAAAA